MCGGSAHMEWAKKSYFENTKVKVDYYGLLEYLISANLGYRKNWQVLSSRAQSELCTYCCIIMVRI